MSRPSRQAEIEALERLAALLDARYGIPGTRLRFGLDSVLGLVPGVGDVLTFLPAAYIVYRAHQLGVPRATLARMAANVGLDAALGSVPIAGDAFDLFFKANRRNLALIRRHLDESPPSV
jgi:Domain of unknown function (DUF4112)